MKGKKFIAKVLMAALTVGMFSQTPQLNATAAGVTLSEEALQEIENAAKPSEEITQQIGNLEDKTNDLQSEIRELDTELVSLLASIETLQGEIADNEEQIQKTETELVYAQEAIEKQYADMKVRIRYMYETGDTSALEMLLESGSIGDFLNRVEYVTSVYEYDRELLNAYTATQYEIRQMKLNLESAKAEMETQRAELSAKQASLDQLIDSKKGELQDFESQLAAAKEEARRQAEEARQKAMIAAVQKAQAEQAAREEAERRRKEAAAAAAAEQQRRAAALQQQQQAANRTQQKTPAADTTSTADDKPAQQTAEISVDPEPTTNISGSSVVAYAQQFVGGPYVWGGNSLTNGCDCSGFVVQVYKHFGINLSGSRHSSALRSVGRAVSFDNIQPGDIVCYSGHVALYAGGGVIVEAQDSAHGITCSRSVTCSKILAIRRVI